jgi:hypothetical protein
MNPSVTSGSWSHYEKSRHAMYANRVSGTLLLQNTKAFVSFVFSIKAQTNYQCYGFFDTINLAVCDSN